MKRRRFLALGGTGVTATSAVGAAKIFSVGPFSHTPSLPKGMQVETTVVFRPASKAVDENDRYEAGYTTVIPDATAADERLIDSAEINEFVAKSDFSDAYLVTMFQWGSPSEELRLGAIERRSDGLHITLEAVQQGGGESAYTASVLLRITDTERGLPTKVTTETADIDPILPQLTN